MSFVSNALSDVGHAIGNVVSSPLGKAAILGAGLYFGAPYLASAFGGGAAAGTAASAPIFAPVGSAASDAYSVGAGLGASGAAGAIGSAASDAYLGSTIGAGTSGWGAAGGAGSLLSSGYYGAAGGAPSAAGASGVAPSLNASNPSSGWLGSMAKQVGSMPLSSWLSIGGGLYGLESNRYLSQLAQQQAAYQTGVMGNQRGYAAQLAYLEQHPEEVQNLPGYQAGLQAVERSMAAGGYLGSGNMMAALQQYGGQAYQQQWQNLAALSGLTTPTNYAAQTGGAAAGLTSSALASIGYGASLPQLTALLTRSTGGTNP